MSEVLPTLRGVSQASTRATQRPFTNGTRLPMLTSISLRRDLTPLHDTSKSTKHTRTTQLVPPAKRRPRAVDKLSTVEKSSEKSTKRSKSETATKKSAPVTAAEDVERRQSMKEEQLQKRRDSLNEGVTHACVQMQRIDDEEIVINKYTIEKCLGQGNFACVSSCRACDDGGSQWAMKEIDLHQVAGKEYCIENEADLMFRHRHRAICGIREAFRTPYSYYLVLEMAENGDLFDAIKREGPFSDHIVAQIVRDTADALRFLHRNNIVHRDIKPENLLLCYDYHVKLTDFGLACEARGKLYRVCGTPTYVAPEILSEIGYGCEVDIWSLGIIMHILLCGYAPFRSTDRNRLFELIKQGSLSLVEPVWIKVDTAAKRLLVRMLQVDVSKRVSARKIMTNKWLKASAASAANDENTLTASPKASLEINNNSKTLRDAHDRAIQRVPSLDELDASDCDK